MFKKVMLIFIILFQIVFIYAREADDYRKAKQADTIASSLEYLKLYENNKDKGVVKKHWEEIQKLFNNQEQNLYDLILASSNVDDYINYLNQTEGKGQNYELVIKKRDILHYENCLKINSYNEFLNYLKKYPETINIEKIEDLFIVLVKKENTIQSYENYSSIFKSGKYKEIVEEKIQDFKKLDWYGEAWNGFYFKMNKDDLIKRGSDLKLKINDSSSGFYVSDIFSNLKNKNPDAFFNKFYSETRDFITIINVDMSIDFYLFRNQLYIIKISYNDVDNSVLSKKLIEKYGNNYKSDNDKISYEEAYKIVYNGLKMFGGYKATNNMTKSMVINQQNGNGIIKIWKIKDISIYLSKNNIYYVSDKLLNQFKTSIIKKEENENRKKEDKLKL